MSAHKNPLTHTPSSRPRRVVASFWFTGFLWVIVFTLLRVAIGDSWFLTPTYAADKLPLTFAAPTATPECAGTDCEQLLPSIIADTLTDTPLPPDGYAVCQVNPNVTEALELPRMPFTPCVGGQAGPYACDKVDLQAFMPLSQMGGGGSILASSLWGWTDPQTGREYALMGLRNKTSFIDITDPVNPFYVGFLNSHTGTSSWRELKAYANHAFIVSDSNGNHGVQIFDLTQLRNYQTPPATPVPFGESAHYGTVGSVHNIWINEATGYAYAVGTASGTTTCSRGVHIFNVQNPSNPTFTACYPTTSTTGYYTHDIDCMIYGGPDQDYQGHEICIASDGKSSGTNDSMAILDVTNKSAIVEIARVSYAQVGFIHQTDFTEDMNYLVLDDELDETQSGNNRRTHIYNMMDLDNPLYVGYYQAGNGIDHNQYVKGDYLYQANYTEGFSLYSMQNIASGSLTPYGYFDFYNGTVSNPPFNGAWNVYPFFESGNVIFSSIEQGLFILRPTLPQITPTPSATQTPTHTPTTTATPTGTNTPVPPTFTPTFTASPTHTSTPTATITITVSNTATASPTATGSMTPSATSTPTYTPTSSTTPTKTTPTYTSTPTYTPTPTYTRTPTVTATGSLPVTLTATRTPTITATTSVPPTLTVTATKAAVPTSTPTATKGVPLTPTATGTATALPPTVTATNSPTMSQLYLPLIRANE